MKNFNLTLAGLLLALNCFAQRPAQNPMSLKKYTPKSMGYKLYWED